MVVLPNKTSISTEEPWVVLDMTDMKIDFLIDMEATYSVLISNTGPLCSQSCTVTGVDRKPGTHDFTGPLTCQFEQRLILYDFPAVPQCPTPLLGKDLLSSLGVTLWLKGPKQPLILTLRHTSQKSKILLPAISYRQQMLLYGTKEPLERP